MTFGAYFFNDDIENYTAQLSGFGIKNFSFTGTAGLQRNNLDGSRQVSYRRFISALNANYQVKRGFLVSIIPILIRRLTMFYHRIRTY